MVSSQLAGFAADIKYEDLSMEVIEMAKNCIQDIIGVAVAGYQKPAGSIWLDLGRQLERSADASVWIPGFPRTGYLYAACLNGALGHVLDMDDLHNASIVHLAVVTVPAALSLGQYLHKNGRDIITAVVAGYDVGARIGEAINPSSYWFWHTTGLAGNFSAAAAAGKLLGLNAKKMNHCFGTAGSQAAGLWEFMYDGAMSKTLHTGKACMNGILSAELAARGFTGASKILEGDKGFLKAVAPEYHLEAILKDLGRPYKIMENSFKPYACCRHTHPAIYAVQELIKEHGLSAQAVESITDWTYSTAVDLTDNPSPLTLYGHKFSLQYCIAAALTYENVLDDVFDDEKVNGELVREIMKKVKVVLDPELDAEYKADPAKWVHLVEINTRDGRTYNKRIDYPLGDEKNPFDRQMSDHKFRMLTGPFLPDETVERFLAKVHDLENLEDVNELFED